MDTLYNLETFKFKNRPFIFFITVPLLFILFIATFYIYMLLRPNDSMYFYLAFIIFIIETYIIRSLISKFRYIPNGKLTFNSSYLKYEDQTYNWNDINKLNFYYRGDVFWKSRIQIFAFFKSYNRYKNLHWNLIKGMDEKILDKIQIGDKDIYLKIRNENEKKNLFQAKTSCRRKWNYNK